MEFSLNRAELSLNSTNAGNLVIEFSEFSETFRKNETNESKMASNMISHLLRCQIVDKGICAAVDIRKKLQP